MSLQHDTENVYISHELRVIQYKSHEYDVLGGPCHVLGIRTPEAATEEVNSQIYLVWEVLNPDRQQYDYHNTSTD